MIFGINDVLTQEELQFILSKFTEADFIDGKLTSGWHASLVKHNLQLDRQTSYREEIQAIIHQALLRNSLFQMAVLPKVIHSLIFNRYEQGMFYGRHTDNALMGSSEAWRSDISLTIFLSEPTTYAGGELVIETIGSEQAFKLATGAMVVYPSTTLHRVEPVTQGVRLAAVLWVQSLVREASDREILYDLDISRQSIFEKYGKTREFDLLSKAHANLLRKWVDN